MLLIERESIKLEESLNEKDKSIESLEKMMGTMMMLNDALKNNVLDSNQAIKCLTEMKVCKNNITTEASS